MLKKLHQEVLRALAADDVKARFAEMGAQPAPTLGAEFNGFIKAEIERWTKVVREQNIQPE